MPQKKIKTKSIGQGLEASWTQALRAGLADDGGLDWTTLGTTSSPDQEVRARIVAKSDGIWAADGLLQALRIFAPNLRTRAKVPDGERLRPGQIVCEWQGPVDRVMAIERPFLNLASYVGGIALRTRGLVDLVSAACPKESPRVTSTRKTLPGYRDLAICGVLAGGGHSHRVSLSGGILIKENHIAAAGSIAHAIEGVRAIAPHGLRIEIEVRDEKELRLAIASRADAVLLDNFTPKEVRAALSLIGREAPELYVEVSGGLNESNIAGYALPGVHVLSVGSLTHSVTAIDLSLLLQGT